MSRFGNLRKSETIKIGDEEFKITSLGGNDMGLFMDLGDDNISGLKKIALASLQNADNTITEEDFNDLPLAELNKLMEIVIKVNNLK